METPPPDAYRDAEKHAENCQRCGKQQDEGKKNGADRHSSPNDGREYNHADGRTGQNRH